MKQRDLLFIVISSTFVVVMWIIFSVLHNVLSSTIPQSIAENIIPISGTFDTKTISLLKQRQMINPQSGVALAPTVTPTPTVPPLTPVSPFQSFSVPVNSSPSSSPTPTPTIPPLTPIAPLQGGSQ